MVNVAKHNNVPKRKLYNIKGTFLFSISFIVQLQVNKSYKMYFICKINFVTLRKTAADDIYLLYCLFQLVILSVHPDSGT